MSSIIGYHLTQQCQFCGKSGFKSLGNHIAQCPNNPDRYYQGKDMHVKCRFCDLDFKTPMLEKNHEKKYHKDELKKEQANIEYYCQYCNRKLLKKNSKTFHEKYCKENPNRIEAPRHPVSKELREQISRKQKENYANGKSRWHLDRSETSYAEKYFIDWLDKFTVYKHNYWTNRYYLDFAWPEKMIYFEVNGEQRYQKGY